MKLWKKKQAVALSLAVLMALPGCQTPDPGTSGSGTSDPSAQQVEAAATDPTHIYEEVGESFLIDAEVSGPPEGVVPKVYRGHYKSFSKEEVDAFLEQVGDSVAEIRSDGIKGKNYHYSGICTNGGRVFLQTNADGTTTTSIFNYDREENALKEYPIYTGQDDYNENKNKRLAFLFEEPVDLACGTAEEAEKAIRAALTALGLSDVVLNRTLYISHDRMVQADELMQSEEWTAGRNAAEYVKNLQADTDDRDKHSREEAAEIVLNPVEGVRYTVPSTINPVHMDENLTVRFRVGGVYKNCYVSVYFDEERVIHKKRPVVAPGEMEQIKLTKEQLMKYPGLKTITVKIEEA